MRTFRIGTHIRIIILLAMLTILAGPVSTQAQEDPDKFIAKLVEQMSPQAKVGQLFLVAFSGTDAGAASDVATLIEQYNVGGVIVSPAAGNIVNTGDTPLQVATLSASLQGLARTASQTINPATGKTPPFIPLFIAIPYSADVISYSQSINGMTPLPTPLTLGATWKREDAQAAGKLMGQELSAMGINVILGPSFDVPAMPSTQPGPAGSQVFGGDPYWVSTIGQAFVRGLHEGSQDHVIAALAHFPGQGGPISSEGMIDESLAEMQQQDLLPFLQAIAVPAAGAGETRPLADALIVTQMRYRGFSGNRLERTRPLAVDAQAMQLLLALPEVKAWRDAGGVLFSDSLGSAALQQYYKSLPTAVPVQRQAQEAFLAGNDVMVLSGLGNTGKAQFNAITTTITSFQDRYSTDLVFQQRVNNAVASILRLKYHLYPGFDPTTVPVDVKAVSKSVGLGQEVTAQVAQDAVTQLWPPLQSARNPLPAIEPQDNILVLTEGRQVRDCSTCAPRPAISTDALARAIMQRYGSDGRIDPARVVSLSFSDVQAYLDGTTPEGAPDIGAILGVANWVVLAIVDGRAEPAATTLEQLLVEHSNTLADKKVVAFSFGAPYALNNNEINRLAAYYGLYSDSEPFIAAAAQVLFGDLPAPGSSPVSIPALGYDLTRQTEPDPNQIIQILVGEVPVSGGTATPQPVEVKVGDKLTLRTGVILDRNGHPVPDNTPVTFTRVFSEATELAPLTAGTVDGVATIEITLDKIGPLRIRASSEPALTSYVLQMTIQEKPVAIPTAIAPPTLTPSPPPVTPTPTPQPTSTPTPTPTPTPPWWQPLADPAAPRRVNLGDLFVALLGITAVSVVGHRLIFTAEQADGRMDNSIVATRWALWCGGAGLAGYTLYGLGIPGISALSNLGSLWASLIAGAIFAALPLAVAMGARQLKKWSLLRRDG